MPQVVVALISIVFLVRWFFALMLWKSMLCCHCWGAIWYLVLDLYSLEVCWFYIMWVFLVLFALLAVDIVYDHMKVSSSGFCEVYYRGGTQSVQTSYNETWKVSVTFRKSSYEFLHTLSPFCTCILAFMVRSGIMLLICCTTWSISLFHHWLKKKFSVE